MPGRARGPTHRARAPPPPAATASAPGGPFREPGSSGAGSLRRRRGPLVVRPPPAPARGSPCGAGSCGARCRPPPGYGRPAVLGAGRNGSRAASGSLPRAERRGAASSGVIETGAGAPSPWKPARGPGSPPRPAPGCPRALPARAARSGNGGGTAAGPGTAGSQPCLTARAAASGGSRIPGAALPAYPLLMPGARSFSPAAPSMAAVVVESGPEGSKWPGQESTCPCWVKQRQGNSVRLQVGIRLCWGLGEEGGGQNDVLSQSTHGCSVLSRGAGPWGQVCNGLSIYRKNNLCWGVLHLALDKQGTEWNDARIPTWCRCTLQAGKQAQKIQSILVIIRFLFAIDICDTVCRWSAQIPESPAFSCCVKRRSRQLHSREDATEEPPLCKR